MLTGLLVTAMLVLAACRTSPAATSTSSAPAAATSPAMTAEAAVATSSAFAGTTPPASTSEPAGASAAEAATAVPTVPFPATPQTLVVQWEKNATLGNLLTDPQGRTLYTYKNDSSNQSTCTGDCATTWPPVTIDKGWQPLAGQGVPGKLGVITRSDGTNQVTYDSAPLYRYSGDKNPGDTNGQGLNNLWYVVPVTPSPAAQPTP